MEKSYGFFEEDKLGKLSDAVLWKRLIKYILPNKTGVTLAIILSFVVIGSTLSLPYLMRTAIDSYITNTSLTQSQRVSGISSLSLIFIILVVAGFIANFFQVTVLEKTGQSIMHRLRQHLFSHLLTLDLTFFNRNPTGKLTTRLTNDIQNMHEMFTSVIITLFNDFIQLSGILIILYTLNWQLALIMTILVPIIILTTYIFSKMARDSFRSIRTSLAEINSFIQESLSGVFLLQHFQRQGSSLLNFQEHNKKYTGHTLYQIKLFGFFLPLIEVMGSLAIVLIIWHGGSEVLQEQMSLGVLAAFIFYMRLFFKPVKELSQKYSIVQSALASAERIFELLDQKTALLLAESPKSSPIKGQISFKKVSFSYTPNTPILQDFSLEIATGETIAIVGSTGSGKTTIINLLERLYDVDSGTVSIDNIKIEDYDLHWLRSQIGLVMQDVYILPGTFKQNICFGSKNDISTQKLEDIILKSQLEKVVQQLPDNINTIIGDGGYELSTGQKQLLALSRILVRDPQIVILDEATASIDSMTEILIEEAIKTTLTNRTSIIIAHRLSTIRNADRVVVLDNGVIVEQGTHQELLAMQGVFYKLIEEQKLIG